MTDFDVGIIGLGAMGAASAHAFARRGARVIAFDRLTPPHPEGSSHGYTRIIREAYYEHPLYVPLVRRAFELWEELQRDWNARIFLQTGGLMVGPSHGPLVLGACQSALAHGIAHEMLDAREIAKRFPAYSPRRDWVGLYEQRAGMLFPERCLEAQMTLARQRGAVLRTGDRVESWRPSSRGLEVRAASGSYDVNRLVVAAGPWLPDLAASIGVPLPLEIERQMSHWFEPEQPGDRYLPERCPIGLWEMPDGDVFATFPDEGHGVKCGMHHAGAATSPATVNRTVTQGENAVARELLEHVMPGAGGRLKESRVCLYTNTPDRHFIIDWVPGGRVLLLSPCSGHGFKFASAIGEVVAQLVLDGRTWMDLAPFSLARFR
jgi:sarcosine oxidase